MAPIFKYTEEEMLKAISAVRGGMGVRQASRTFKVPKTTLLDKLRRRTPKGRKIERNPYLSKAQELKLVKLIENADGGDASILSEEKDEIFTLAEENALVQYYKTFSKMNCNLSNRDARQIAFQMAIKTQKIVPKKWTKGNMADKLWLDSFMKRYPELNIEKSESYSFLCSDYLKELHVKRFFQKIKKAYTIREPFANGSRVYNLDEISVSTMQNRDETNHEGEMGDIITICCIINALGSFIPPAIVFPCSQYEAEMIEEAPPGSLGLANSSGWMTPELFIQVIQHFIKFTRSSKQNPSLLIMDNHESHLSIEVLDLARKHGLTILTFHSHCSSKLQPLDVGMFASLKAQFYSAMELHQSNNKSEVQTSIHDIVRSLNGAHQLSLIPLNIKSGFKNTGVFPYDSRIHKPKLSMSSVSPTKYIKLTTNDSSMSEESVVTLQISECHDQPIGASMKDDGLRELSERSKAQTFKNGDGEKIFFVTGLSSTEKKNFSIRKDRKKKSISKDEVVSEITINEVLDYDSLRENSDVFVPLQSGVEISVETTDKVLEDTEDREAVFELRSNSLKPSVCYTKTMEGRFKCCECEFETKTKGLIKNHFVRHTAKAFKCPECSYKTNWKSKLKIHSLIHSETKLFKCDKCDYEGNHVAPFKRHMLSHAGIFKFNCSHCSFKTNTRSCLTSHELVHSNIKLLKCSDCDFECNHQYSLKRHEILSHGKFKCLRCKYVASSKDDLKSHMRVEHETTVFECFQCFYITDRLYKFNDHIRKHAAPKYRKKRKRKLRVPENTDSS